MSHPYLKSLVAQTADVLVATGKAGLSAVLVTGDGVNVPTVTIWDNTSATGTKVFEAILPITVRSQLFEFAHPVRADTGLFLDVTGTGCTASVYYV
jgi:hypothetical protein